MTNYSSLNQASSSFDNY